MWENSTQTKLGVKQFLLNEEVHEPLCRAVTCCMSKCTAGTREVTRFWVM